jgi:hypothetical protein
MNQVIIGFSTEGTTDVRLLESIIQRTFEAVASECQTQIEVSNPIIKIDKEHGADFVSQMSACAKRAFDKGVMAFCIHVDSDDSSDSSVFINKINPLFEHIRKCDDTELCKILLPVIPVQMSESWMLADKQLLKDEIGTNKSDLELGINRSPENYANPKSAIEGAIRIARQDIVKRRRHELRISELYQPIGQKIDLTKLEQLSSYTRFKEAVRDAYRSLNYLH